MTEQEIFEVIGFRFCLPRFVLLSQVRSQPGFASMVTVRTADAVAFSCWKRDRLSLHGFEIKSDRQDLRRELGNPEKAWEISRFCDFWWLALGSRELFRGLEEQIPPEWGVMYCSEKCHKYTGKKKMVTWRAPKKLEADPLNRKFVVQVMKRFVSVGSNG